MSPDLNKIRAMEAVEWTYEEAVAALVEIQMAEDTGIWVTPKWAQDVFEAISPSADFAFKIGKDRVIKAFQAKIREQEELIEKLQNAVKSEETQS